MPFTYTNRKGITHTLYRKIGADGKLRYVFGRNVVGEPVDELPQGYRVSESPNGIVSVARDRPSLIRPEEIAAVEAEVQRHPRAKDYRLAVKEKRIEIYAKVGADAVDIYRDMLAASFVPPGKEAAMREIDERFAQFVPVLRIILRDPERRIFGVEQLFSERRGEVWRKLKQTGEIATLAGEVVPVLPTVAYVFVPPIPEPSPRASRKRQSAKSAGKRSRAQPTSVHQLKVTLLHSQPPIWRRIAVPSDMTLGALHYVLQLAMGWSDSHLHSFQIGKTTYGDPEMLQELGDADEWTASLARVAPSTRSRLLYTYDFGDNWEHDIQVEAVGPPAPGLQYPVCLAGRWAGPPDDCGGIWGYVDLLEALADPDHPEHDDMMEWTGGPIDPEAFDLEEVNRRLARLP
ncbi:MAG: plasmid pRiA4b ORF-3 family protein [Thermomicrobiales bacterium]